MFSYDIKIPKERIAVLIGTDGETKDEIEEETKTEITVDSQEGDVNVAGEDAVKLYDAQHIIKAVARGFNPDIALQLLKQDYAFELIRLTDYSTKKNHQQRLKGRVIGTGGKARRTIERLTDSNVSVYGKTIGIIAPIETIGIAKDAVQSLLEGAQHSNVFKRLERQRRDIKMRRLMGTQPANPEKP